MLDEFRKIGERFGKGGVAGAVGVTVVYPIDLVKTRMQNQTDTYRLYKNSWDCFKTVIRKEGPRALYKGLSPQLIGVTPEKAIKLTVNDTLKSFYSGDSVYFGIFAGAAAGASQVIVTNPLEIVKIRLQIMGEKRIKKSASKIVSELGLRGLYQGSVSCFMRDIPFSAIYFPLYDYFKDHTGMSPVGLLTAGTASGVVAAGVTTPADVIKTRMQVTEKPIGIKECTKTIIRQEGYSALFKGIFPRVTRSAPQFGVTLFVYEILKANSFEDKNFQD